ncbi:Pentatricopeptide repeat-containing protein [Spatholobus suberectus]|nr:Pentatricopeptide repeat-containing protein [Spatholobus suberectus]
MVTSKSHLSSAPPLLLPVSIHKLQNSNQYHSPTLKFTQLQPKPNVLPIQHELHINLNATQQLHGHFIKTCSNCSYQVPFAALESYSSNAAIHSFLITSYIKNNCPADAAKIYAYMRRTDTEVDNFIIPSVLKACCLIPSILLGQEVHGFVVKNGFHRDVFVCNALIMMYSGVGNLASARLFFDKIENNDAVSWSTMIRSYDRSGLLDEALDLLRDMHVMGVKPSEIAMISITHVLAEVADLKLGKAMHAYVLRNRNCGKSEVPLSSALMDMYVKCKNLAYARRLFDGLSDASIISWTAMIAAYIHCNNLSEGLRLFVKMLGDDNAIKAVLER